MKKAGGIRLAPTAEGTNGVDGIKLVIPKQMIPELGWTGFDTVQLEAHAGQLLVTRAGDQSEKVFFVITQSAADFDQITGANFDEHVIRGIARAAIAHVSGLSGGAAVTCASVSRYLHQRSPGELDTALLSSDDEDTRHFWREFQCISPPTRERLLLCAKISLAAEGERKVKLDQAHDFAWSITVATSAAHPPTT